MSQSIHEQKSNDELAYDAEADLAQLPQLPLIRLKEPHCGSIPPCGFFMY